MISIFDAIRHRYPGIQRIMYWQSQYDGSPWKDPYDGLVWENTEIEKPTKEEIEQWRNDPVLIQLQVFDDNKQFNNQIHQELDQLDKEIARYTRIGDQSSVDRLNISYSALTKQLKPTSIEELSNGSK